MDRLTRFFRRSSIVKPRRSNSACDSTRSFSTAPDIAHEPIFISRTRAREADHLHLALLRRSLSLDRSHRRNLCAGCRPSGAGDPKDNKNNKKVQRRDFYQSGELGDGEICPPVSPSFESFNSSHLHYYWMNETECGKKKNKKKKRILKHKQRIRSNRFEVSLSSSFGEEGFGLFSSDENDVFFSSKSFSSDSSEFYRRPCGRTRKNGRKTEQVNKKEYDENSKFLNRRRRNVGMRKRDSFINGFQPVVSVCCSEKNEVEKSGKDGFAVMKKSNDPYSDFRSSMVEMIVERQIFGAKELQSLLHCYLSLNSPEIHSAILRAFADISQVLFSY